MMSPTGLRDNGLTLVEVLVSVVLLSVVAVVVMPALARVAHAATVSEQQTSAYLFALSKLADLEQHAREGKELADETGTVRLAGQPLTWQAAATPTEDPTVIAVSLRLSWPFGTHTYEQRFDTLLRTAQPTAGQ